MTTTLVLDHIVSQLKCYYFLPYDRVADVSHYRKLKSRCYCTHPSIFALKLHDFFILRKDSKSFIHKLFRTIKSFHVAITHMIEAEAYHLQTWAHYCLLIDHSLESSSKIVYNPAMYCTNRLHPFQILDLLEFKLENDRCRTSHHSLWITELT